jgi:hypothetical protein
MYKPQGQSVEINYGRLSNALETLPVGAVVATQPYIEISSGHSEMDEDSRQATSSDDENGSQLCSQSSNDDDDEDRPATPKRRQATTDDDINDRAPKKGMQAVAFLAV